MGKTEELWWFIVACGVEIIAIGVGVMISPTWGWVIAIVGLLVIAYALYKISKAKRHLSKILKDLDVSGIVYKAMGGSGGKSGEAENFVVFDENDIRIDHRKRNAARARGR